MASRKYKAPKAEQPIPYSIGEATPNMAAMCPQPPPPPPRNLARDLARAEAFYLSLDVDKVCEFLPGVAWSGELSAFRRFIAAEITDLRFQR